MYKVRNPYKECHMLDLNLMSAHEYKRTKFSPVELMVGSLPVLMMAMIVLGAVVPELGFYAECQNIPGGDVCSISLK